MTERWFQVDLGYACFGICSRDGTIMTAAPIGKWMLGKTLQDIKPWLLKKKAKVYELQKDQRTPQQEEQGDIR